MIRLPRISAALTGLSAILILAAGCADRGPTEVELRPADLKVGEVAHALIAPVGFRAGSYSQVIGPKGGILYFGTGTLSFPAGAVAEPTLITAAVDGATLSVSLSPHGLTFPLKSRPILSFNVGLDLATALTGTILYVDQTNVVLENLGAVLSFQLGTARTPISHFSKFIFGAN